MKRMRTISTLLALVAVLAFATNAGAATIVINNVDGAGEGFNDPTPVAPVGGNPGVTLGQQRLNAFTYAAELAGACLVSTVPIIVSAAMNPLFCDASSAILGSAGAVAVLSDFAGAPLAATWYPIALGNAITGVDNDPGNPDISAQFNSSINGSAGCLSGYNWYYGLDGILPAGNWIDFVSVVEHECIHGLGFQSFINVSTGAKFAGLDDDFERLTENHGAVPATFPAMTNAQRAAGVKADPNLHFTGANVTVGGGVLTAGVSNGHVRLHGPAALAVGSTMSHWSTALTPNELMEPNYTGVNHNRGLALALFQDIGWTVQCPVAVAISSFGARSVDRGVELSARFQSSFGSVLVKVYRGEGAEGGLNNLVSIAQGNKTTFTYVDETAVPGRSYRYMIGVVDQDGEFVSPIQTITLPKLVAELGQNVPNPFNPTTSIRFTLTSSEHVTINVFDVSGHLVRTLVDGVRAAGAQDVKWDGTNSAGNPVSSGIYYYRLQADKFSQSRKMVLLK